MKRFNIFVGNYGSGKTEISLNTALELRRQGKEVVLADVDIVNPYFRSSEHQQLLKDAQIRLIMPPGANTNVDIPSLPLDIYAVFNGTHHAVLDCGGDPAGATALGALKHKIAEVEEETEVYFVMNARRPLQQTAAETLEMLRSIEYVSRLKVTGIINNTNLADETTVKDLLYGQRVASEVSRETGIPLSYVSGKREIIEEYLKEMPQDKDKVLVIQRYMKPEWM